jgi:adenosylcobinamide-GDP ribazoletransferase
MADQDHLAHVVLASYYAVSNSAPSIARATIERMEDPSPPGPARTPRISVVRVLARLVDRTIFPLPLPIRISMRVHTPPGEHGLSAALFPLLGAFGGAISVAAAHGALRLWPAALAAVLAWIVQSLVFVFDYDGLVDCADALPIRRKREDIMRIFKDPNMGAFGGTALLLVAGGQLAAVASVPTSRLIATLWVTAVVSRWGQLVVAYRAKPAYEKSTAKPFIDGLRAPHFAFATLATAAITYLLLDWQLATAVLASATLVALAGRYLSVVRLGGVVGDVMGAVSSLVALTTLLVAATR